VIRNHQRYRQTDRRTDRQTDGRQATATPFHAIAWDGKKYEITRTEAKQEI